jgi:hypothetical protein
LQTNTLTDGQSAMDYVSQMGGSLPASSMNQQQVIAGAWA